MTANLLADETSPYLLQHKGNPVRWMAWGPAAFERARHEDKPILLSIGYAACHWCHVMARESFENPAIAGVMNELFVSVKVDREERPDLDQIYQSALALLGQPGGWPLTMFLTPAGEPFWGGTYFPPAARFGRPGFPDLLATVAEVYRNQPEKVASNVTALKDALAHLADNPPGGTLDLALLDPIAERLVREFDPFHGGLGTAPKFPQVPVLELVWRAWLRTGQEPFRAAVTNTLTHMCQGGIYDHLGGGFARYTTDAAWLVPHFEKMLYDNAQLIDILTLVWQQTRDPLYAERVAETAGWVLREMIADAGGGFASTLDADSEHVEGKFYVWTEAEIDAVLGADAPLFKAAYDVTASGNWEETNILSRNRQPLRGDPAQEETLGLLRARLWQVREQRVRPGWDDKVLADWNGLMIAALANAGLVFHQPGWIDAAEGAFAFVVDRLGAGGRLRHGWRQGQARHPASLDDYAAMARAALALAEATGDPSYRSHAEAWVGVLDRHYWDEAKGGYCFTADDGEPLIVRSKHAHDNATPSGNGLMVGVLARLFRLTGKPAYAERAEALVAAFAGELARAFLPLATLLNNAELLRDAAEVAIVGQPGSADARALADAVLARSLPNCILSWIDPDAGPPAGHPAFGKTARDGRATAYVCRGMTCSAPAPDPAALAALLETS